MKLLKFQKRPAHTLLFVTEVKTFRIAVDRKGVMLDDIQTIETDCPGLKHLPAVLQALDEQGPALGRKLWLLPLMLPMTLISLPAMQVQGVDEETLLQALQFELEGLTGQSTQNTQLNYQLLNVRDEMSYYRVSQIDELLFEDILKAAKNAGSRLAGLLHPGGLPEPLGTTEAENWLRMECWPEQILVLHRDANGMTMESFATSSSRWHSELEHWLAEQGTVGYSETLFNNKLELVPGTDFALRLNDGENIALWLDRWAGQLLQKNDRPAAIITPRSKLNRELLLISASGLGALLLCIGHFAWHNHQKHHYQELLQELQRAEGSMAALRKEITSKRDIRDALRERTSKLEKDSAIIPDMLTALQQRPARLLEALARGRPGQLLVEAISQDEDDLVIRGAALDALAANQLASYLEQELRGSGWQIGSPTKKDLGYFQQGGPWEFSITLTDLGIAGFQSAAATAGADRQQADATGRKG